MSRLVTHLWFETKALEAAEFYVSLLPHSKIDHITALPADSPSGPAGSVQMVEFTLMGAPFVALAAGPLDAFNHAISLLVECDDQKEIDRLWTAFSEGGQIEECGWLKDRYGVSWQIVPKQLAAMMRDPDGVAAKRVAEAMLTMKKLDLAALERARDGKKAA